MYIKERNSAIINLIKGYMTLLVVILHTSFDAGLRYQDGVEPFIRIFISKLGAIAVPIFFLISGYLFFSNLQEWDWNVWKKKVQKRGKTLFIPYILWIVIAFVFKFLWGILKKEFVQNGFFGIKEYFVRQGGLRIFYDRPLIIYDKSILGYLVDSSKPIDGPLWYVRELMILVLLSPVIWRVLKVTGNYALLGLGTIFLLFIGLPFVLVSPTSLFFFSIGAAFSISGKDFLECFRKWNIVSCIFSAVFLALSFVIEDPLWNELVSRCFVMAGVVMMSNLIADLYDAGRIKPVQLFTDSSFFIYVSHAVLITEISNFLLWRVFPITAEWMLILKVFLRPAVAVGICLLLFVAMKKICPKFLCLLTGGRC